VILELRRRALSILLLPIVIFIFVIGWSLSWIGEKQNKKLEVARAKTIATEDDTSDECVEVGLIENLMERMLETE